MPIRHCIFAGDLAEMEKNFQLPLKVYVEEFLERPAPGHRLRDYAELAFAPGKQISDLRRADRQTMIIARKLKEGLTEDSARADLARHLDDVTADFLQTRTSSQLKWFLHALDVSGRPWARELACGSPHEWLEELLRLLFAQRGFVPVEEGAEANLQDFRAAREAVLRLASPFPLHEAANEVRETPCAAPPRFPWPPREEEDSHFRFIPGVDFAPLAGIVSELDLGPEAFDSPDRPVDPRMQEVVRANSGRFREFLALPYTQPAVLAFTSA